jgi:hypothetical protein
VTRPDIDVPLVHITVFDQAESARRLYGDRAGLVVGRPLPDHDYRFSANTPTGGEITFHRGATAADVAAYWRREGWLP